VTPELPDGAGWFRELKMDGFSGLPGLYADSMSKPFQEMTDAERTADRIAKNRAIDHRIADRPKKRVRPSTRKKVLFTDKDGVGFTHADTFPAIASVIKTLCGTQIEYVGHGEIVAALLKEPELKRLLDQIQATNSNGYTREFWAHSMMKWFSQTITESNNLYADEFERHPTARPYRYRLRQG
jgi:hypothetical protein